jgi:Cu-processing system permease protein
MRPLLIMAMAEIREGLRNRWIVSAILGLTLFAFSLALLGSAPIGEVKASALSITTVSLASLSVYLIPLIALMLAFDAIVGEAERGTLLLLLTYPIKRWQVLAGKFLGHMSILSLAVVIGYGLAGLYISLKHAIDITEWLNYGSMIASTLLLGSVFLSIGYLLSVLIKERATAIGASIAVWLVMIVVYDFMLLGLVLSDKEQLISGKILAAIIYLNPTDIYRLFNLAGNESAALISGMGDLAGTVLLQPWSMIIALLIWIATPLIAAISIFHRTEV